jgi:hypothetical protein
MNMARPKVLVSWYTTPAYIQPFRLSDDQVTFGPKTAPNQPLMMFAGFTPLGRYDLRKYLEANHITADFDLVVVWSDPTETNVPDVSGFDCPKVLCVGDTHHLTTPLQKMVAYAESAPFDFIVSSHNRHHLHWFIEAGFTNVAWLPGLKVRHLARPFRKKRVPAICFVGQHGRYHPRRARLLAGMTARGLPVAIAGDTREGMADLLSSWQAAFNASLNGDLNLRVFEVLSAGGCLLTDRLSEESGLDLLLEEGREFIAYDGLDELTEKAAFLLRNPKAALAVAKAGNSAFVRKMTPRQRASELLAWVFDGHLNALFNGAGDKRYSEKDEHTDFRDRMRVYEELQHLHWELERPAILFSSQIPRRYLLDVLDLRHAVIGVTDWSDGRGIDLKPAMSRRVQISSLSQVTGRLWDRVVTVSGEQIPDDVKYGQRITINRHPARPN